VAGIHQPLWCTDMFPEKLQSLARHDDLRRVVLHPEGGPLTTRSIQQCSGSADPSL
jgi:hypothetical protein